MIDALLFSVRDNLRSAGFGYNEGNSEITEPDGRPEARCGNVFVAIHQIDDQAGGDGRLDETYSFGLTLTMRIRVNPDRVGDTLLASSVARQRGPKGQPSFNARADQLRAFFHNDWGTLQDANTLLAAWTPDLVVYGFCEPARYKGGGKAVRLEGADWFDAKAEAEGPPQALVATLRFEGCRRMQALETFT